MKQLLVKLLAVVGLVVATSCGTAEPRAPFFVQISDPQLGFINESEDFAPELANMERIAVAVNDLKPDFVVFSGDFVQWRTDSNALQGFEHICGLFDESIPLYFIPGNHDVGNEASAEEVARFVERYGHDRFLHEGTGYTAIGYNSCVIKAMTEAEGAEYEWLKASLARAAERSLPIVVVAHHPIFAESVEEAECGENLPHQMRSKYLELLKEYGTDLALAGHLHRCESGEWQGIRLSTSAAAGRPLGSEGSGVTIVTFDEGVPTATFYEIDDIPESI